LVVSNDWQRIASPKHSMELLDEADGGFGCPAAVGAADRAGEFGGVRAIAGEQDCRVGVAGLQPVRRAIEPDQRADGGGLLWGRAEQIGLIGVMVAHLPVFMAALDASAAVRIDRLHR
jgi:hypothetical protein